METMNRCLEAVFEWMRDNKLKFNPDNTEMLLVGGSPGPSNGLFPVLGGVALPLKEQIHSLGVLLDPGLLSDKQVAVMSRGTFHQLRPFLDRKYVVPEMVLQSFYLPCWNKLAVQLRVTVSLSS